MANTFLSADLIVEESLPILADMMQLPALVWQDPSDTYANVGDTVQARLPAKFSAVEFDGDLSGEYQDVKETSADVKMNKIASVDVNISSKERTLSIEDFMRQVGRPAMSAIVEKLNYDILELALDIPYYAGSAGTTPNALSDIANTRKVLNLNKVPQDSRSLIIDPEAAASFATLDALVGLDKSGSTSGLREASFGRVHQFGLFENPQVLTFTPGAYTSLEDVTVTSGAAGATTIELTSDAGSSTDKLKKGDRFTVEGYQYVVTADTDAATAGVISSVNIYPGLHDAYGDMSDASVTFVGTSGILNMGFHQNAFAFVSRQLSPATGGASSQSLSFNGLNLRVTFDYDMDTKTEKVSFDVLYGVKTVYPELAAILYG